jgi:hypothetical protein
MYNNHLERRESLVTELYGAPEIPRPLQRATVNAIARVHCKAAVESTRETDGFVVAQMAKNYIRQLSTDVRNDFEAGIVEEFYYGARGCVRRTMNP